MVNKIGGKLGTVLSVSTGEVKYRCRFSFSWSSLLFRSLLARIGQTVILYARRQTPDGGRTANQNENIESESHDFHFDGNLAIVDVCRPLSCVMVVACGCSVPCPADPRIRTHVSQKEWPGLYSRTPLSMLSWISDDELRSARQNRELPRVLWTQYASCLRWNIEKTIRKLEKIFSMAQKDGLVKVEFHDDNDGTITVVNVPAGTKITEAASKVS